MHLTLPYCIFIFLDHSNTLHWTGEKHVVLNMAEHNYNTDVCLKLTTQNLNGLAFDTSFKLSYICQTPTVSLLVAYSLNIFSFIILYFISFLIRSNYVRV